MDGFWAWRFSMPTVSGSTHCAVEWCRRDGATARWGFLASRRAEDFSDEQFIAAFTIEALAVHLRTKKLEYRTHHVR